MKLPLIATSAMLALAAAMPAAQAATVSLTSWTWGEGHSVDASAPVYSGQGGGFSGTLSGASGFNGLIETYCVELTQSFGWNTVYTDYSVVTAASYFSAAKASTLDKLITYVFGSNLFGTTAASYRDELSTALQLAIWNVAYDVDTTLSAGAFTDNSAYTNGDANFAGANTLFANSANQSVGNYQLYVLTSPTAQDQLIWRATGEPLKVPEPTSLALSLLALGGLGVAAKRRSTKA